MGRGRSTDMAVVHAIELRGGLVEVSRKGLLELSPEEPHDGLTEQGVGPDSVEAVEGLAKSGVVEPGGLGTFPQQQFEVRVREAGVHPPQRDPAGEDVEHHHREALGIGGVCELVLREVPVHHVHDAELVQARADDGKVADDGAADFELGKGHASRSPVGQERAARRLSGLRQGKCRCGRVNPLIGSSDEA